MNYRKRKSKPSLTELAEREEAAGARLDNLPSKAAKVAYKRACDAMLERFERPVQNLPDLDEKWEFIKRRADTGNVEHLLDLLQHQVQKYVQRLCVA